MAQRLRLLLVFVALCLFSFAAIYPLAQLPAWYFNDEFDRYLYLIVEFRDIFESGQWYPRWASRLMHGFGYPTFVFYQPGAFFYILPFTYLPITLPHAFFLGAFFIFLISGAGAYRLARLFDHDRILSTLWAGAFMFMPYAYTNLVTRGDYGEFISMMLTSWVMYGVFALQREAPGPFRRSSFFAYVLGLVGVFFSHPHVALFMIATIVWFVLMIVIKEGLRSRWAWSLSLGGVFAATLTASYWFTMLSMSQYGSLFRMRKPVGKSMSILEIFVDTTPQGKLPWIQSVGLVNFFFFLMAVAGLYLIRRRNRLLFWQCMPLILFTILLNMNVNMYIWHKISLTSYFQYSWRITSLTGILIYIGMLQLRNLKRWAPARLYRPAMALLILAGTFLQPYMRYDEDDVIHMGVGVPPRLTMMPAPFTPSLLWRHYQQVRWTFANQDEFTPRGLNTVSLDHCLNTHRKVVETPPQWHFDGEVDKAHMPYRIRLKIDVPATGFPAHALSVFDLPYITINQVYFPGWVGEANGRPLVSAREGDWQSYTSAMVDDFGRIRLNFPAPGHYEIEAYYDGPLYWLERNIAMAVILAGLWQLMVRMRLIEPFRVRKRLTA